MQSTTVYTTSMQASTTAVKATLTPVMRWF